MMIRTGIPDMRMVLVMAGADYATRKAIAVEFAAFIAAFVAESTFTADRHGRQTLVQP